MVDLDIFGRKNLIILELTILSIPRGPKLVRTTSATAKRKINLVYAIRFSVCI